MFKAFFERRRVRKSLERCVSRDFVGRLLNGELEPDGALPAPTEREVEVVYIALDAPDATTFSNWHAELVSLAFEHGARVEDILPVAGFSFNRLENVGSTLPGSRRGFISAVQSRFPEAAIVHGTVMAHVGMFGSKEYLTFGIWWPGLFDANCELGKLLPGQVYELASSEPSI